MHDRYVYFNFVVHIVLHSCTDYPNWFDGDISSKFIYKILILLTSVKKNILGRTGMNISIQLVNFNRLRDGLRSFDH